VELLRGLHSPDRELFFIIGADIFPELPLWYAPAEVLQLATLVVVTRPGAPDPAPQQLERALPGVSARVHVLRVPGVDVSSSELRARIRADQPVRYLMPPAVEQLIRERGLYREGGSEQVA
jgi:nicotinate-nucleotide adenylyltransferase